MAYKDLLVKMLTGYLFVVLTSMVVYVHAADEAVDKVVEEKKWTSTVAAKKTNLSGEKDSPATLDAGVEVNRVSKNIQQLKHQVIDLNKDLRLMEEKLLFPSSTKYSVFVSMSSGQFFALESIKLKLDGKLVAAHLYSEKQRQALIRGGVHKFYITNLNEGKHSATIFFTGVGPNGRAYKRASTIDFEKGPAGEYLEVAISDDSVTQEPVFGIKQW